MKRSEDYERGLELARAKVTAAGGDVDLAGDYAA